MRGWSGTTGFLKSSDSPQALDYGARKHWSHKAKPTPRPFVPAIKAHILRPDLAVANGARTEDNADQVSHAATKIRAEFGRTGTPVEESPVGIAGRTNIASPAGRAGMAQEPGGPV